MLFVILMMCCLANVSYMQSARINTISLKFADGWSLSDRAILTWSKTLMHMTGDTNSHDHVELSLESTPATKEGFDLVHGYIMSAHEGSLTFDTLYDVLKHQPTGDLIKMVSVIDFLDIELPGKTNTVSANDFKRTIIQVLIESMPPEELIKQVTGLNKLAGIVKDDIAAQVRQKYNTTSLLSNPLPLPIIAQLSKCNGLLAWHPTDPDVIAVGGAKSVRVWQITPKTLLEEIKCPVTPTHVEWTTQGKYLLFYNNKEHAHPAQIRMWQDELLGPLDPICFSPQTYFLKASDVFLAHVCEREVNIHFIFPNECVFKIPCGPLPASLRTQSSRDQVIAWHPDGHTLAIHTHTTPLSQVQIWNCYTKTCMGTHSSPGSPTQLLWSPAGDRLITVQAVNKSEGGTNDIVKVFSYNGHQLNLLYSHEVINAKTIDYSNASFLGLLEKSPLSRIWLMSPSTIFDNGLLANHMHSDIARASYDSTLTYSNSGRTEQKKAEYIPVTDAEHISIKPNGHVLLAGPQRGITNMSTNVSYALGADYRSSNDTLLPNCDRSLVAVKQSTSSAIVVVDLEQAEKESYALSGYNNDDLETIMAAAVFCELKKNIESKVTFTNKGVLAAYLLNNVRHKQPALFNQLTKLQYVRCALPAHATFNRASASTSPCFLQ